MKANQADLPVRALCETLKISTSGYYDWCNRPASKRAQANTALSEHIRRVYLASDETYGMPRIRAELGDADIHASRKRIARLMRAMRLQGVSRRRAWCVTTERNKRQRPAPDLVKRLFVAKDINELWVADMTYIPTWEGFLYLAVVTDACSRKVVGWAFGVQMTADLVLAALNMALHTRRPESVIHHSDQGSQGVFNRSLQHWVVDLILDIHLRLRLVSSSRVFFRAWCSAHWRQRGSPGRSIGTGRYPWGSIAVEGHSCFRSCLAAMGCGGRRRKLSPRTQS